MAKTSFALNELVSKLPDPDERGMYCTDIDETKIEKAIARINKGGHDSIIGLVNMLVEPGKGDDVKPRYALHCLAVYVCKHKSRKNRKAFANSLAMQLADDYSKAVKSYLIRQLQVTGGREVVPTLGKLLHDEELCEPAAQALVAIGSGAATQLRNALPEAGGKCRLTIIQNLGVVRDRKSVSTLNRALGDEDRETRLAAAWALANIGDPRSVEALLKAADSQGWERIQATKACLLLAEKLLAADMKKEALRIYAHLRKTRSNPDERYVREAAEKGLAKAEKTQMD